jgi:hypothetical protein
MEFQMAPAASPPPTAAFLYSYELSQPAAFDAGYKEHLEWHRSKNDHLTWYGWKVVAGSRVGAFIDGTFGSTFSDIDRRPDLAGDAKHFERYVAPYGKPLTYEVFASLAVASTAFPLESHDPSAMVDVYYVQMRPDQATAFEQTLASLKIRSSNARPLSWYRGLGGMELPSYVLMVPRASWSELELRDMSFPAWLAGLYNGTSDDGAKLTSVITKVRSETWSYRADLSSFPKD